MAKFCAGLVIGLGLGVWTTADLLRSYVEGEHFSERMDRVAARMAAAWVKRGAPYVAAE